MHSSAALLMRHERTSDNTNFFNLECVSDSVKPQQVIVLLVVLMNEARCYSLHISRDPLPPASWKHMTCGNSSLWIHSLYDTDSRKSGKTIRFDIFATLVLADIKIELFRIFVVLFVESHKHIPSWEDFFLMDMIQAGSIFCLFRPSVFAFLFFLRCCL